jgi:hypothetical protein
MENKDLRDLVVLLGLILGIVLVRYIYLASKKLQIGGVSNKERWRIIRDPKTGQLLELEVSRDVEDKN